MKSANNPSDQMVLITRTFDAPRALVFKAWSDPAHLQRWFAPRSCTLSHCVLDFRVGGKIHTCISTPQFGDCWCIGTYREIVSPARIVYTISMSDAKGNLVESAAAGKDNDWPRDTIVTVTFAESAGRTTLTLHQNVLESIAKRTGAYPSWLDMLDQLAEVLKTG